MEKTSLNPGGVAPPVGSYSHAVRIQVGDAVLLFVSGQLSIGPDGEFVGKGDMASQTEQVYRNLGAILEAGGATFRDVVRVGTFITDMSALAAHREVRMRYLTELPPASTSVQVTKLFHPDALLEVDAIAVISV